MILGGSCLTLIGLALGEASRLPPPTPGAAFAFFYLLIVGSLVGFIAYNWLLGHVSATQASTYAYVNPVVAVLIAWCDGEEMTLAIVAGITVILVTHERDIAARARRRVTFVDGLIVEDVH